MGNIIIKNESDLAEMRKACKLASRTLVEAGKLIEPGITTDSINQFVHEYTLRHNAKPAPLGYRGYPKSVCTSVNEVICHGIPSNRVLQEGDIINVDVTSILNGWHGDVSATFYVGEVSDEAKKLVEVTRECLQKSIAIVKPGVRLGDIGALIQQYAESRGYSVVRDFVGHGIGRSFHEAPQVTHFGKAGRGQRLAKGMTFTIEPMINQGDFRTRILDDDWTAITIDGKLSAQFEHTIAVTENGVEVMTAFDEPLLHSEVFP
ncbi:MAG: type I methionyl aminopeptidase [Deltaproteobacteria bacterium]|nr:type I methionyl aminopeptidase [Deltaproteobacteria bacterium]MBN2671909.1 type I methionyl aminopeptidase [Deltaproteobacteria bacterium]